MSATHTPQTAGPQTAAPGTAAPGTAAPGTAAPRTADRPSQDTARQRLRATRREALLEAARVLLPDHGIAYPLARIAVHAGLPRAAASSLFNATTDVATELVCRDWAALAEIMPGEAHADAATAEAATAYVARLIGRLRAYRRTQIIRDGLSCGAAGWQIQRMEDVEATLARTVGRALLGQAAAGLSADAAAGAALSLGRLTLALCGVVVRRASRVDAVAEARIIVAMLAPTVAILLAPPVPAPVSAAARPKVPAPAVPAPAVPAPMATRPAAPTPARAAVAPLAAPPVKAARLDPLPPAFPPRDLSPRDAPAARPPAPVYHPVCQPAPAVGRPA